MENKGIEALLEPCTIAVPVKNVKYWDLVGMYKGDVINTCEHYVKDSTILFQHCEPCLDHYHAYIKKEK